MTRSPKLAAQLTRVGLAAGLLALAAACSGGGSPQSSPAASASSSYFGELNREVQLRPLLVGCFAKKGLIPAKDLDSRWYQNGQVVTNKYWLMWWRDNGGLAVKFNGTSMLLEDIVHRAATTRVWPTNLCGPLPPSPAAS